MLDINRGLSASPAPSRPPLVSWDEFHDGWDREHRTEWVNGEIIEVSPENIRHHLLAAFLFDLVRFIVRREDGGYVFMANVLMRLQSRPSGRVPDILFVAKAHLDRLAETYVNGPADLVVEVVSPESQGRDRQEKLAEYEAAGIPEYWIVDEASKEALFYVLDADGRYRLSVIDASGIYTSTVLPGLRVRTDWLWRWPLPDLEEALADLPA